MNSQKKLSFIEEARRNQIMTCAIEIISSRGYAQASLAQIAKVAGISKGVISYHFSSKDDLIEEIVSDLYESGSTFMTPYLAAQTTALGWINTYIEKNVLFMKSHRKHVIAVTEIIFHARDEEGKPRHFRNIDTDATINVLVKMLHRGTMEGDFREFTDFSARVLAATIRSAIDGLSFQLAASLDLDLDAYAKELVTIFQLAARKV
ncbi:TetR/AcrR family transcriptional regulator [Paenibacillus chitinolyticus]|jgi:AcrR family transcriptional regulator|uniref:TetR/AcrR family transcriptional regulator n=1 Tax=Paenibacillus chitinolyticus TaxID=79263 RepID=UPI002DBA9F4E|nr:TetR/AcrR family transcriptional regulator [Paenibacillus chitinolyticus]MEC0244564.1 TetR/AcrR family transcriptional regulator [Paenibacillus chitinolyticus]